MPIVKKSHAKAHFKELDERVTKLKNVMTDGDLNMNLWDHYSLTEADFERDFVQIDEIKLSYVLTDLEAAIKAIRKTRDLKASKLHTSK